MSVKMLIIKTFGNVLLTALGYCVFSAVLCLAVYGAVWFIFGDTRSGAEPTPFCNRFPTECNAYR